MLDLHISFFMHRSTEIFLRKLYIRKKKFINFNLMIFYFLKSNFELKISKTDVTQLVKNFVIFFIIY